MSPEAQAAIDRYEARQKQPRYLHRSTKVVLRNIDDVPTRIVIGQTAKRAKKK